MSERKMDPRSDRESIYTDQLLSDSPVVTDEKNGDEKNFRSRKNLRFERNKKRLKEQGNLKNVSLNYSEENFPPIESKNYNLRKKNIIMNEETLERLSTKETNKYEENVGSSENERGTESWTLVERKRKKQDYATVLKRNNTRRSGRNAKTSPIQILRKKFPQTVVISITCGPKAKYADVLLKARESVKIEEIGIDQIKARRAITGGLLLEIIGDEAKRKAEKLVNNIREALKLHDVKVIIPQKRVELHISGFDESVTVGEIISKLAEIGGGHSDEFRHGDIKNYRSLGSLWTRCPLEVALRIMEAHKLKKIKIGWCSVEIEILKNRPMQCFKCFALGHPIQRCPSVIDRSDKCINCGESGHFLRNCINRPKCLVCQERGLNNAHRVGSEYCRIYPPKPMGKSNQQGEDISTLGILKDKNEIDRGEQMEH